MAQILARTVRIFNLLAANPRGLTVTELSERLAVNKSTASRLLASLADDGLIERDEAGRHYLDIKFWSWGVQAARRLPFLDIARPHISAAVREWNIPAFIAVVRGEQTIYLESITPQDDYIMLNIVSYVVPAYACAPGKAILAFSSDEIRDAILSGPLERYTAHTLATTEELREELQTIRTQGYSINRAEYYENNHLAIAAPILDSSIQPVAAICFYAITDDETMQKLVPPLLQLADVISSSLGYRRGVTEFVG